jgi:hypothetical protein
VPGAVAPDAAGAGAADRIEGCGLLDEQPAASRMTQAGAAIRALRLNGTPTVRLQNPSKVCAALAPVTARRLKGEVYATVAGSTRQRVVGASGCAWPLSGTHRTRRPAERGEQAIAARQKNTWPEIRGPQPMHRTPLHPRHLGDHPSARALPRDLVDNPIPRIGQRTSAKHTTRTMRSPWSSPTFRTAAARQCPAPPTTLTTHIPHETKRITRQMHGRARLRAPPPPHAPQLKSQTGWGRTTRRHRVAGWFRRVRTAACGTGGRAGWSGQMLWRSSQARV